MIAPIGTHPASYYHERAFAERFAASPEAPRDPPHPVYPWVLGPEHAPAPAPCEPLDAVRARFAGTGETHDPGCDVLDVDPAIGRATKPCNCKGRR